MHLIIRYCSSGTLPENRSPMVYKEMRQDFPVTLDPLSLLRHESGLGRQRSGRYPLSRQSCTYVQQARVPLPSLPWSTPGTDTHLLSLGHHPVPHTLRPTQALSHPCHRSENQKTNGQMGLLC